MIQQYKQMVSKQLQFRKNPIQEDTHVESMQI